MGVAPRGFYSSRKDVSLVSSRGIVGAGMEEVLGSWDACVRLGLMVSENKTRQRRGATFLILSWFLFQFHKTSRGSLRHT